jgi:soluble lytic murein transglycosylase
MSRAELAEDTKVQLQRAAALGGAYSRDRGAVAAFEKLPAGIDDTAVQEWRVRAALWIGDFAQALTWIGQMPADLAAQPRWRYWRARALDRTQGSEAAQSVFAELAAVRDYYGYLAADRLEAKYRLNAHPLRIDAAIQKSLAADDGLIRARALFNCDLYDEAEVEWAVALANASTEVKIQAAILASRWGWHAQAIAELAQLAQWDDVGLRYPHPFDAAVARASQRTRVPGNWIYAVMRQESLYRRKAVSSAGARGLMQVLPTTAAMLAKRWNVKLPPRDPLFDPSAATMLGAAHLRELLDDHGGALPLSLAAYNAGSVPVARWRPAESMDADIWIENIPYQETRVYVQRVLEHIVAFAWVRKERLPRLSSLMPRVLPRGVAERHGSAAVHGRLPGATLKTCRFTSATLGGNSTLRRWSVRRMFTFRPTTSTLIGSIRVIAGYTTSC